MHDMTEHNDKLFVHEFTSNKMIATHFIEFALKSNLGFAFDLCPLERKKEFHRASKAISTPKRTARLINHLVQQNRVLKNFEIFLQ